MAVQATHFAPVPTALLRDPSISSPAKALYALIRSYADFGKTDGAHPSQTTICEAMGCTLRSLLRWRSELRKTKWLRWKLIKSTGGEVRRTDYICNDLPMGSLHQRREVPASEQGGVPAPEHDNREPLYRETYTEKKPSAPTTRGDTWLTPFATTWTTAYGGTPAFGELAKHLAPLVKVHPVGEVLEHWERYLATTDGRYANAARFAQTFGKWGKPERPTAGLPDMYLTREEQEARRRKLATIPHLSAIAKAVM
jgi:Helix-turn-helix domain